MTLYILFPYAWHEVYSAVDKGSDLKYRESFGLARGLSLALGNSHIEPCRSKVWRMQLSAIRWAILTTIYSLGDSRVSEATVLGCAHTSDSTVVAGDERSSSLSLAQIAMRRNSSQFLLYIFRWSVVSSTYQLVRAPSAGQASLSRWTRYDINYSAILPLESPKLIIDNEALCKIAGGDITSIGCNKLNK